MVLAAEPHELVVSGVAFDQIVVVRADDILDAEEDVAFGVA
jgi:hypothetical protein